MAHILVAAIFPMCLVNKKATSKKIRSKGGFIFLEFFSQIHGYIQNDTHYEIIGVDIHKLKAMHLSTACVCFTRVFM